MGFLLGRWLTLKKKNLSEEEFNKWKKKFFRGVDVVFAIAIILIISGLCCILEGHPTGEYRAERNMFTDELVFIEIVEIGDDGGMTTIGILLLLFSIGMGIGSEKAQTKEEKIMRAAAQKYILNSRKIDAFTCSHCHLKTTIRMKDLEDKTSKKCQNCNWYNSNKEIIDELIEREKLFTDNKKLIEPYMDEEGEVR